MRTGFFAACFVAALAASPPGASAALITYTETADVSGSLDGMAFSNDLIELTLIGDTSLITGGPNVYVLQAPMSFTLSGGGSGTFTDGTHVFSNQGAMIAGFSDTSTGKDILDIANAVFGAYDLSTAIGPVSGIAVFNSRASFATSAGPLVISSVSGDVTFTASVVPEISTWTMLLLGFLGVGIVAYRAPTRRAPA
jgi:hypothetical protein